MKINLPSTFILENMRANMIGHTFISELDEMDYQHPRKNKYCEILCSNSMERCSFVKSQILAKFCLERVTY